MTILAVEPLASYSVGISPPLRMRNWLAVAACCIRIDWPLRALVAWHWASRSLRALLWDSS
ncbi:hypothetical protein D3C76_1389490 [compost metagenome]